MILPQSARKLADSSLGEGAQKERLDGVLRPPELADSSLEEGVQRECFEGGFALPR